MLLEKWEGVPVSTIACSTRKSCSSVDSSTSSLFYNLFSAKARPLYISRMSRRTFIQKWDPKAQLTGSEVRSYSRSNRRLESQESKVSGVRRAGDLPRLGPPPRITRGRLTQRVGLFRNAKCSQIVVNEISSVVRRASNKQIERLVAPEREVERFPEFSSFPERAIERVSERGALSTRRGQESCYESNYRYDDEDLLSERASSISDRRPLSDVRHKHSKETATRISQQRNDPISDDDGEGDSLYGDMRTKSLRRLEPSLLQRYRNPVRRLAAERQERMQTPARPASQRGTQQRGEDSNHLSLSGVAARVLSALPPIYLRDDHHEKYDSAVLQLLGESINRRNDSSKSSLHPLLSFLDRTGAIAVDEKGVDHDGDAREDVFQEGSAPGGANEPFVPQFTPELEKLFNRTVADWRASDPFGSPLRGDSRRNDVRAAQVSAMMTPLSTMSSLDAVGVRRSRSTSSPSRSKSRSPSPIDLSLSRGSPLFDGPSYSGEGSGRSAELFEW